MSGADWLVAKRLKPLDYMDDDESQESSVGDLRLLLADWKFRGNQLLRLQDERDAARAEVERLRTMMRASVGDGDSHDCAQMEEDLANARHDLARLRERDARVREAVLTMLDGPSLCAAKECQGHCGFVHLRGCAAIKDWCATEWADALALLKETP